jgi:hypothetical protein
MTPYAMLWGCVTDHDIQRGRDGGHVLVCQGDDEDCKESGYRVTDVVPLDLHDAVHYRWSARQLATWT